MCIFFSHEHYTTCNHRIACHLKYSLRYCAAPNGIPLPDPDRLREPGYRPSRACDMDDWGPSTAEVDGLCPVCVERMEMEAYGEGKGGKKSQGGDDGDESEDEDDGNWGRVGNGWEWDYEDWVRWFDCGHYKFWIRAASLQGAFVVGDGRGEREGGDGDGDGGGEEWEEGIDLDTVVIDEGDFEIAEWWETDWRFSWEGFDKLRVKRRLVRRLCGECEAKRIRGSMVPGRKRRLRRETETERVPGQDGEGQVKGTEREEKMVEDLDLDLWGEDKEEFPSPQIPPIMPFEEYDVEDIGNLMSKLDLAEAGKAGEDGERRTEEKLGRWRLRSRGLLKGWKDWIRLDRRKKG
ncbi:hypothetical protein AJ79_09953 [Helicocarpus griseus UAMH5409]|uniref:Uncharacterized protein n=1 Tax=Helicocarpus griseus UAMH5409 TaxID=1447875 RepID=A0A2B7WGG2_9EURO|nr:hypothetical protein AJ79_09953 [Helicocarpus griseus UAMH5409]